MCIYTVSAIAVKILICSVLDECWHQLKLPKNLTDFLFENTQEISWRPNPSCKLNLFIDIVIYTKAKLSCNIYLINDALFLLKNWMWKGQENWYLIWLTFVISLCLYRHLYIDTKGQFYEFAIFLYNVNVLRQLLIPVFK